MDATRGLTCTTNAQGVISVTRWDNLASANAGWAAVPAVNAPQLLEDELNHLPIVDMGALGSEKYMRFKNANGANDRVKNIRAVFWVIGSQNGGGYLMGGGTNAASPNAHYNFHRGVTPGANDIIGSITHENRLIGGPADTPVKTANWHLNGEKVNPTGVGLSGGYDLLSMVVANQSGYTEAEGFAFDGRIWASRASGQRLGEVLIFDRMLSDLERRQVELYLHHKWGFSYFRASGESNADFDVASGATLSLGGETQPVRSVCGNGAVSNGTLEVQRAISAGDAAGTPGELAVKGDLTLGDGCVWTIDLANGAADKIVVDGTCTFADPQRIALNNLDAIDDLANYSQVVMSAGSFANAAALARAQFTTEIPRGVSVNMAVKQNDVVLKFGKLGLVIMVR